MKCTIKEPEYLGDNKWRCPDCGCVHIYPKKETKVMGWHLYDVVNGRKYHRADCNCHKSQRTLKGQESLYEKPKSSNGSQGVKHV